MKPNLILYYLKRPKQLVIRLLLLLPYFDFIKETRDYQCRITFEMWFLQKVLNMGGNKKVYWPVHFTSKIVNPKNILVGIDTNPGFMGGCYIQGIGIIKIGDYTQIASNVSIISSNHDLHDSRKHIKDTVIIGKYCWLGTGVIILPGVTLGDFTIVGAGSVVTKSFPNGQCVIAGNPAKIIKKLEQDSCIPFENKIKYYGYIKDSKFGSFQTKFMKLD